MNRYRYWLPSTLTLLNLALGVAAMALNHPVYSLLCIVIGCFFDVFDGILARLVKGESAFGKELDSLADIVTFGVAPAMLVYRNCMEYSILNIALVALLPVFSAIRLARFNNDASQKTNFSGLPTPANGLFFASMPFISETMNLSSTQLTVLILLFSFLMVSPIRMFAFKDFGKGGPDALFPLIFLVLLLVGSFFLSLWIVPAGVLAYILLSLLYHLSLRRPKRQQP